ncbi:hypothetical protein DOY81_000900 [Sarcophaga bullata]|nr:hypothetical protein DOY81_000900 [Sarcophaga bullata]
MKITTNKKGKQEKQQKKINKNVKKHVLHMLPFFLNKISKFPSSMKNR